jgi:predicted TIM-barrel fold metal-dependent hydrolase
MMLGQERIMLGSDIPHSESHPNSFRKILGENAVRFFTR